MARTPADGAPRLAVALAIALAVVASLSFTACRKRGPGPGGADAGSAASADAGAPVGAGTLANADATTPRLHAVELGPEPALPFPSPRHGGEKRGATLDPIALEGPRVPALRGEVARDTFDVGQLASPRGSVSATKSLLGEWFVLHEARSAASVVAGGDRWVLVEASTGLWLHEDRTLARRARLAPPPIDALAVAPDGAAFAFVAHRRLTIVRFPSLEIESTTSVDDASRVRFSNDGRALVVASAAARAVTLFDRTTKRTLRHVVKAKVNDAIAIDGCASCVAWADDADDVVLYDLAKDAPLLDAAPRLDAAYRRNVLGIGDVTIGRRDQHAVAFDPTTGVLYGGGDDDRVWRFPDALHGGGPVAPPPFVELRGNVREILRYDADSLLVALDSGAVHRLRPTGEILGTIGPLDALNVFHLPARVSAAPPAGDPVLAALEGYLVAWSPRAPPSDGALIAADYQTAGAWTASASDHDTALVDCKPAAPTYECVVARVVRPPAGAAPSATIDVAAELLGTAYFGNIAQWIPLAHGARALVGPGQDGQLRVVVLPAAGKLRAPFDSKAAWGGELSVDPGRMGAHYTDPHGGTFAILDADPPVVEQTR